MSKTLTVSDATADELLVAPCLSETAHNEIVAQLGPPPPEGEVKPPPIDNSQYTKILNMAIEPWTVGAASNKHLYTARHGHMMPRDAVFIAITTPAVLGNDNFGSLGWTEMPGDPIQQRRVVLSEFAGDFDVGLPGTGAIVPAADNASLTFSAGPNSAGYVALTKPNHTYYFNVRNVNPDEPTPTGHMDLDFEFRNPK